jgi:hypothetical protein
MASDSWGRWGEDDELGALNLIGVREVLRAAGTLRRGQVVRLGQDLGPSTLVPRHRKEPERLQARVALDEILRRIPDFAIPDGYTPLYGNSSVARKLDELKLVFTPGNREGDGA